MLDTTIWLNFWNGLGLSNSTGIHALKELEKHYNETHRFYHNTNHINECIYYWNTIKEKLNNPQAVLMAIYFHDAIYEPLSHENEENSLKFMNDFFSQYSLSENTKRLVQLASNMILLTKQHGKVLNNLTLDEKYLMDIDCSILGSNPKRFEEYENQIRQEYIDVEDKIFYPNRKNFLESCSNIKIFHTPEFSFYLEKKSKRNIEETLKNANYQNNVKKIEVRI